MRRFLFAAIFLSLGMERVGKRRGRGEVGAERVAELFSFPTGWVVHLAPSESVMYLERNSRARAQSGKNKFQAFFPAVIIRVLRYLIRGKRVRLCEIYSGLEKK